MSTVSLLTTDEQQVEFSCEADETIVAAAKRQGYYLQAQCQQGSCGACVATTTDRDNILLNGYDSQVLSEQDLSQGKVLLCCTTVSADTQFQLPYSRNLISDCAPQRRDATIAKIEALNADTYRLILQLDEHPDFGLGFDFEPGQFAQLFIPGTEICRPYSMAIAPGFTGELEFFIKIRKGGAFSTFLSEQAVVDMPLSLEGPFGSFMLSDNGFKPRLFIAGGCGLASTLSMLRRMAEWQESHPATLLFGVWNQHELFALPEIKALCQELPQLDVKICITEGDLPESVELPMYSGSLLKVLAGWVDEEKVKSDVYICGSTGLINSTKAYCLEQGFEENAIYYEYFR